MTTPPPPARPRPRARAALLRYGPAVGLSLLVPALSLLPAHFFRPAAEALPPVPGFDKVVHLLLYAALCAAWLHALPRERRARPSTALCLAGLAALFGLALELAQSRLTDTRACDPADAAANAAGAVGAAGLTLAAARRRAPAPTSAPPPP